MRISAQFDPSGRQVGSVIVISPTAGGAEGEAPEPRPAWDVDVQEPALIASTATTSTRARHRGRNPTDRRICVRW